MVSASALILLLLLIGSLFLGPSHSYNLPHTEHERLQLLAAQLTRKNMPLDVRAKIIAHFLLHAVVEDEWRSYLHTQDVRRTHVFYGVFNDLTRTRVDFDRIYGAVFRAERTIEHVALEVWRAGKTPHKTGTRDETERRRVPGSGAIDSARQKANRQLTAEDACAWAWETNRERMKTVLDWAEAQRHCLSFLQRMEVPSQRASFEVMREQVDAEPGNRGPLNDFLFWAFRRWTWSREAKAMFF